MEKEEQLKVRLTRKTKRTFKETLSDNGHFISGVIMMFVDAYIKRPQETIQALKRLSK